MIRLLAFACFLLVLTTPLRSQSPTTEMNPRRGWLTVDTIMQDPKWMGTSPDNVFWSEDGRKVYFNWRRGGDEGDSLYAVDSDGGTPAKVSFEERGHLPSRFGDYTRDRRMKVYSREGDLFLYDTKRNTETRLTKTLADESTPRFAFDGKKIVFTREGNLFERTIGDGVETQLTNIQKGSKPSEDRKTDLQKLTERQQLELFEVLRERKSKRDAQKQYQESIAQRELKPFFVGQKNASAFVLSPDEHFITFVLSQRPADAKRTIVPSYVTESGYTEDIPGRTMVGEPETKYEFYVYNVELDTVVQVKTDDIPDIIAKKAPGDTSKGKPKPRDVFFNGPYWSDDGKQAFVQVFSQDNKDRWIVLLDCANAKFGKLLDHQHDEAWIGGPGIQGFGFSTAIGWMPDSKRVYFQSEADGWSHLYTVSVDNGEKVQLTKGR
ncbi:MAG TPA: DPP IV N-terminal domain-containing protein, partial [Bacteroidota bacterium]|nr:DPP IV N-terminal domain-containing protein [Bacteroidota bacterium]